MTLVRYTYNSRGELVSAADALGQAATYRYSDKLLVQETFKHGLSFYFEYVGAGPEARCTRTGWQRLPGRGGLTSKLRAVADARGRFVRGGLTVGQRHDTPQALPLLAFGERLVTGIALIFNSFLDSLLSEEEAEDAYYAVHQ